MNGFVQISKYAGMREDLVQAGGGNSSYKISEDKMVIKASGSQLADVTDRDGYAVVNPKVIRDTLLKIENPDSFTEKDSDNVLKQAYIEGKKPSIETFLHAISGKYTLHTHPVVVNVLTCRNGGMQQLSELFPKSLIVPYATPGVELAKAYFKAYRESSSSEENKTFDIVFLQNHGMVVSAETAEEVITITEKVTETIEKYLGADYKSYHKLTALWKNLPNMMNCSNMQDQILWKVTDSNVLNYYSKYGEWMTTFCPDSIVFLGKKFLKLSGDYTKNDIEQFILHYGLPVIIDYVGVLYIIADCVKKALEIQSVLSFSAQVMNLNREFSCHFLNDEEQNYLLNWDAEKYRKNMK